MTALALHAVDSSHFDKTRRDRAARGAAGANKRWGLREPFTAYALPAKSSRRWIVRWLHRGGKYKQGSVNTREEAEALVAMILSCLRAGIAPPPMPRGRAAVTPLPDRPADEIAAARERIREMFRNPARCELCGLTKPCDPCLPELTREIRSARGER